MVTITTDYGTFEADTMKEAQALERKARKLAEKERQRIEGLREVARHNAKARGFNILAHKVKNNSFPSAWTYYPADAPGPHSVKVIGRKEEYDDDILEVETEHGRGRLPVYRNSYVGYVMNCAGAMAIALRNSDGSDSVYSVGVHEGEAQAELLPCVTVDDFRLTKRIESQVA